MGVGLLGQEKTGSRCATGDFNWISGKRLSQKLLSSPSRGCLGHWCSTWGHGLVMALAELEEQLDLIMESFSHLNNSVILCLFRILIWAAKISWNSSIFSFNSLVSLSTFSYITAGLFYHLPHFILTSHLWISYSSSTSWTPPFTDCLSWTLSTDTSVSSVGPQAVAVLFASKCAFNNLFPWASRKCSHAGVSGGPWLAWLGVFIVITLSRTHSVTTKSSLATLLSMEEAC